MWHCVAEKEVGVALCGGARSGCDIVWWSKEWVWHCGARKWVWHCVVEQGVGVALWSKEVGVALCGGARKWVWGSGCGLCGRARKWVWHCVAEKEVGVALCGGEGSGCGSVVEQE